MSPEISNPFSTGGGGQFFEAKVQASFLLHLLIGGRVPCLPSGKVETVRLQAKQAGFNTDDIAIKICTDEGVSHRLLVQIKHHVTITASDEEFKSALESAWSDFSNQSLFIQGRDALALITGPLSEQTLQHVRPFLDWARTSETSEEFIGKVATAQFSSDKKRGYLQIFRDVLTKVAKVAPTDEMLWQFIKHFYLLSYDFDVQGGKDEASILTVLDLARNQTCSLDTQAIWEGLIAQAQEWNKTAGTLTYSNISERLRLAVQPQRSAIQREAISKLKEHCDIILGNISTELAPAIKISRVEILDALADVIESSRIVVVQGAPGSGKSAIVKMLFDALSNGITPFAFKAQEFNQPHIHQFLSSIGINLTLAQLRCEFGLLPRKILLVDGAERLFELSSHEAFRHLLQQLNDDPSWTVVITCRESSTQELREHLLAQWGTDVTPVTVPPLSSEELTWISTKAPQLSPLIANQRLAKLLRFPFILSLAWRAFPTPASAETASNVDERQFKDIVWKGYIERAGDTPGALRIKRGQCLISVSVERARRMNLFIPSGDRDVDALNSLTNDGILIKSSSGGFAPAHDVLEDWAVSRFIAQEFDSKAGNPSQFVEAIGTEPAMRRNFRLWLSEALMIADSQNVIDFVSSSFQSTDLAPVWRDEIAVAALQSKNAGKFIQSVEQLLLQDDKRSYKQLVHVLRTACKGPNEALLRNLGLVTFRNHIALQSVFAIPSGSGWRELILFTHRNLSAFDLRDINTILRLLKDWSQGVGFSDPLPSESEAVAQICFKYWELLTVPDLYAGELAQEFLQLLFKIPQAAPTQIESLIRSVMANDIAHEHHSRVVLEHVVKSIECQPLCTHFPNLVIEVAKKIWTARPEEDHFSSRLDIGDLFGLGGLGHSDYFPESALQGPFSFLFAAHPEAALDFVVQLTNAATATYSQSSLGNETHSVQLLTQAGSRSLLASPRLWVLYRGMMPAPNVLECALMAMEVWLSGQAKQGNDVKKAVHKILDTSTSVATIAVLASVATAYPEALGDDVLPLLQIKEFYRWDLERSIQEKSRPIDVRSMMGIPTGGIDDFYYQERKTQADLPHRTNNLEHLAVRLQFTPLQEKIQEILDGFQKSLPTEKKQSNGDKSWRIALHRMDTRHFKVSPSDEPNEVILTPGDPEPDLKKYIENAKADFVPIEARLKLANWGMAKFRREIQSYDAFPNWKDALREAQGLWEQNGTVAVESSLGVSGPAFVAAVLVRDHYTELEPNDLAWCRKALIKEVLIKDSERTWNTHIAKDPFDGSRPSAFVLPLLLRGSLDKATRDQIEECMAIAVTHTSEEVRNYAAAGIKDWLWDHDPDLAKSCVSGLFELAATQNQIRRDQRKRRNISHEKEEDAIWEAIRDIRVRIVKRKTDTILKSPIVDLETHDWPELLDALNMLKPGAQDPQLKAFVMACLNATLLEAEAAEAWKADDRCHYEFQYPFAKLFASFVLAQPLEEAEQIGSFLSGYVKRCPKYLSVLLEKLPYEEDRVYSNRIFWSIWKKVSEPIFAHPLLRGTTRIWRYSQLHQLVRILLFAKSTGKV